MNKLLPAPLIQLLLIQLLLLFTLTASAKDVRSTVKWLEPADELERMTQQALRDSNIISDFASLAAGEYTLEPALSVVVGGPGQPAYDADRQRLSLPYAYLTAVVQAQAEIVEERPLALERGLDMIEYTLYHMFGHVLAGDQSVDADDQAEEIATWLMVTHWPNGGEQWLASVRAFGKASQVLDGPLSDYWHAHSLYKSRQSQLECAVLGSDPLRYESLMTAVLEPLQRRQRCQSYWQELDARVKQQISPFRANAKQ